MPPELTFTQAIETLTDIEQGATYQFNPDLKAVLKLSIECLKFCQTILKYPHLVDRLPLPGDTKY